MAFHATDFCHAIGQRLQLVFTELCNCSCTTNIDRLILLDNPARVVQNNSYDLSVLGIFTIISKQIANHFTVVLEFQVQFILHR